MNDTLNTALATAITAATEALEAAQQANATKPVSCSPSSMNSSPRAG
ncbi:hypothetical protein [Deinococcus alpinitundrae]|nr:hypothetical protein [Deinococcus alpinitundrae]